LNIKEFLRPTALKLIITLLMPVPVYILMTFSIANVLDFYWYLFTPTIKFYADIMYQEFNPFILLWIPFYLAACLIEAGYRRGSVKTG
jgi:hypothetical protein